MVFGATMRRLKAPLATTPLCAHRMTSSRATGTSQLPPTVVTYERKNIPTHTTAHRIPLSIVDIHLRNEQLPFCYFFQETLDAGELEESLRLVLQAFPQTGGVICSSFTAIQCQPDDTVHLSFGNINTTLEDWQSKPRGHLHHSSSSADRKSDRGHPVLLPLFDSLFENNLQAIESPVPLVKIRVTYFEGKGTAIGVNFCHALGDTATCVHFVQCWGKQMRHKVYFKVGTDRSRACVSGMMTADIADVMGLGNSNPTQPLLGNPTTSLYPDYISEMIQSLFAGKQNAARKELQQKLKEKAAATIDPSTIPHEYVRLIFSKPMLERLKEMGSSSCDRDGISSTFVSTNDMLTSYGWILKRHLSQNIDHNLSMVINLRGRSGVDPTLFGNGISHAVASHESSHESGDENYLDSTSAKEEFTDSLCSGAKSIRQALQASLLNLSEALSASQMGRALAAPANSTQSFSTTSWGQFPLYQIRFAEHTLSGFHGHPAHPLPRGRTFASVITPCPEGSYWYEMLLPSDQAQQARDRHVVMTAACMDWVEPIVVRR